MAYRAGQAYIDIVPSLRGFNKTIERELKKELGGLKVPVTPQLDKNATRQAQQAGGAAAGAYAREFQRRLDAALKALPDIKIRTDTTEAETRVQGLRNRLQALRDLRLNIDIDAGEAQREADAIARELAHLDRDDVRIDIQTNAAAAAASLGLVREEADRLDGRTVKIRTDVDAGHTVGSLRFLSGSVNSLIVAGLSLAPVFVPALGAIAVAAGSLASALAGPLAGLGGFFLAALPAITAVTEAVKAQEAADKSAATSAASTAAQRLSAAYAAQQAARAVADAERNAAQVAVDGQRRIEDAVEQVARTRVNAARMIEQAERRVADAAEALADAQEDEADAQQNLNEAREEAIRQLRDMKELVDDLALDEQQAELAILEAQLHLQELLGQDPGTGVQAAQIALADAQAELNALQSSGSASQLELAQAHLAVTQAQEQLVQAMADAEQLGIDQQQAALDLAEAEDNLSDIQQDAADAQTALNEAQASGIDGMDVVVAAQEALQQATEGVADAMQDQADAQQNLAQVQADAAQQVADAEEQAARAREEAARANESAARAVADAMAAQAHQAQMANLQMVAGTEASRNLAYALGQLTPMQQLLLQGWNQLSDAFTAWAESLEPAIIPVILQGFALLQKMLPTLTPIIESLAAGLSSFLVTFGEAMGSPQWQAFFDFLAESAGPNMEKFLEMLLNLAEGFAGILLAFAPVSDEVMEGLLNWTEAFADWGMSLGDNDQFQAFIDYVIGIWPQVKATLGALFAALVNIVKALAPLAGPMLAGLEGLFNFIAAMPPELIITLAGAFLSIAAGIKAWSIAQAALNLGLKGLMTIGIVGLIAAIILALVNAYTTSETFRKVVDAVFKAVWNAIKFVYEWIRDNWKTLLIILSGPFAPFVALFIKHFDTIRDTVMGIINWIRDNWRTVVDFFLNPILWVIEKVGEHKDTILGIFSALVDGVVGFFQGMFDLIGDIFGGLVDLITDPVGTLIRWLNKYVIDNLNKITSLFGFEIDHIQWGGGSSVGPQQTGHGNDHVTAMNSGGIVPGGGPDRDSVHTFLTPGEGVITRGRMREMAAEMGTTPAGALARIEAGSGGPFDFITDIATGAWGAISSIGSQIGDWLKQGAAFAMDKVMTPLVSSVVHVIPGPEFIQRFFRGALDKGKDAMIRWAEGKDNAQDKLPGSFDAKGKYGFPLPRGSYRVGRGPLGHGYQAWDFPAPTGTPVFAPMAGTLRQKNMVTSYGRHAYVDAGNTSFLGAHFSSQVGAPRIVSKGELIGRVGSTGNSTGPHLHAEFRVNGARQDPANFLTFDQGGYLPPGLSAVWNGTGVNERVLDPADTYQYDRGYGGLQVNNFGTPTGLSNEIAFMLETRRQAKRPLLTG